MQGLTIHEDSRRTLIEWIADSPFRSAKAVVAKGRQAIGAHYHRNKDEVFLLLSGMAISAEIGDDRQVDVAAPARWEVPAGVYHRFELEAGSILLGAATRPFDPEDEIPA